MEWFRKHGKGSTFWFTVKLAHSEQKKSKISTDQFENIKVLYADGSNTYRNMFLTLSKIWDIDVTIVDSAVDIVKNIEDANSNNTPYSLLFCSSNLENVLDEKDKILKILTNSSKSIELIAIDQLGKNKVFDDKNIFERLYTPISAQRFLETIHDAVTGIKSSSNSSLPPDVATGPIKSVAKILLAEDNLTNQVVARGMLKKSGFIPDVVSNGLEAVDAIKSEQYKLIFMDVQMPVMDGYEATRQIKDIDPSIIIIAMTANAMKGDKERCLAAGMDDYLSKPVNIEAINGIIKKWL